MKSNIKWWEFVLWLLPMILAVLLAVQRNLVFSKADYGMWTEDSLPLFLWGVVSLALLLGTQPWKPVSRFGSSLRLVGIVLATGCTVFVLLCTTSWGRYKLYRFEALTANFYITNYVGAELASPIETESGTGEYVARDPKLRELVLQGSGLIFLSRPKAAAVVVALELGSGTTFEEVLGKPGGPNLLLGTLVNQVHPDPWSDLKWFERPDGSILTEKQGRAVVKRLSVEFAKLPVDVLESLLFVAMHCPELFEDGQRESLFEAWAAGFEDLQPLAVEGLVVRRQVAELLPAGKTSVKVAVTLKGGTPSTYYYRNVDRITRQMTLGLVRSCGVDVVESPKEEADLEISIFLSEIAHHTYSKPTYDYETYYENRLSGRSISGYQRTRQVAKERQVISGYTEEIAYAPVARITLTAGEQVMELPEMLLFWHHLRYDHEKGNFMDLKSEGTYGRMWPFGLDKRLFEWDE